MTPAGTRRAPYLCTDATGVLVQARERCRRGHFWVVIAPERHVLFMLGGYQGYLVVEAHVVFDHLARSTVRGAFPPMWTVRRLFEAAECTRYAAVTKPRNRKASRPTASSSTGLNLVERSTPSGAYSSGARDGARAK